MLCCVCFTAFGRTEGEKKEGAVFKKDSTLAIRGERQMASAWDTYSQEEWGNLALLAATMKNTARAHKLEHRDRLSKILQATEM